MLLFPPSLRPSPSFLVVELGFYLSTLPLRSRRSCDSREDLGTNKSEVSIRNCQQEQCTELQGLEAEIDVAEQERVQAVGSHVEGMEQLFRLQGERLDGIRQTFNKELEVHPPDLCSLSSLHMVRSPEEKKWVSCSFRGVPIPPAWIVFQLYLD